jgi:hypothetical protein
MDEADVISGNNTVPKPSALSHSGQSSSMAPPFKLATDMIPKPVLRGSVGDIVQVGESAEIDKRQRAVQPA